VPANEEGIPLESKDSMGVTGTSGGRPSCTKCLPCPHHCQRFAFSTLHAWKSDTAKIPVMKAADRRFFKIRKDTYPESTMAGEEKYRSTTGPTQLG